MDKVHGEVQSVPVEHTSKYGAQRAADMKIKNLHLAKT